MPVEAADEFERELLEVSALLASTVDRRRNQLHRDSLVDVIDAHEDAVETAARLVTHATTRVDVVLAAEPAYSEAVHDALTALLSGAARTTSRVRLLCTPSTLDWRFVSAHAAEPRVRTRVARIPALVAVIADNEHALVCAASVVEPPGLGGPRSVSSSRWSRSSTGCGATRSRSPTASNSATRHGRISHSRYSSGCGPG